MKKVKNAYSLINKKGRNTVPHCTIGFYYNQRYAKTKDPNSYDLNLHLGDLEIIDKDELETIVNLVDNASGWTEESQVLFDKYSVTYITAPLIPLYIETITRSEEANIDLINFVKALIQKYKVDFEEISLPTICLDISLPKWYYQKLLDKKYYLARERWKQIIKERYV
ncbi:hypothetical protein [Capnocytophaga bilenii]